MKTQIVLFIVLILSFNASGNTKRTLNLSSLDSKKVDYTPIVKVQYNLSLSNRYDLKYSLTLPMKKENLSLIGAIIKKSRFESKPAYQPRFQNLEKVDLASIVEKNKLYNLSKSLQIRTY